LNSRPRHLIYILNRRKMIYFSLPDVEPFIETKLDKEKGKVS